MTLSTTVALMSMTAPTLYSEPMAVLKVERNISFAGKLGREVREVLTVQSGDRTYTIQLPRYHTRMGTPGLTLKEGDSVSIKGWNGEALVDRSRIRVN